MIGSKTLPRTERRGYKTLPGVGRSVSRPSSRHRSNLPRSDLPFQPSPWVGKCLFPRLRALCWLVLSFRSDFSSSFRFFLGFQTWYAVHFYLATEFWGLVWLVLAVCIGILFCMWMVPSFVARIKPHELRTKSKADLLTQLNDLKTELALLRVAKVTGGAPNKLSKMYASCLLWRLGGCKSASAADLIILCQFLLQ